MRVWEIMTKAVREVAPDLDAEEAFERMAAERIHHLVVIDRREIVGVVSQRDLGGPRGEAVRAGRTVGELMSDHVVTIEADESVRRAANLMRGHEIGSLPVLADGRIVGIVTVSDILDMIGRGMESPPRESDRQPLRAARHAGPQNAPHARRH
jgi:CBS domain-containing protein